MMNDALCVVHPRAAGLDVHKGHITATVRLCTQTGGEPQGHRGGPADPDAGARPPRRQGGRQLGGPRPRDSAIRRLAGPQLHPGRSSAGAAASLHAGIGGDLLQPGPACEVPPARRAGKAPEGCCGRRHAQAPRAGFAVMRKLLVLANVLLGEDRCWLPERPGQGSANSAGSAPLVTA